MDGLVVNACLVELQRWILVPEAGELLEYCFLDVFVDILCETRGGQVIEFMDEEVHAGVGRYSGGIKDVTEGCGGGAAGSSIFVLRIDDPDDSTNFATDCVLMVLWTRIVDASRIIADFDV